MFLFGILVAFTTINLPAANRTWDGGSAEFDGLWANRTNWICNTNIAAYDALFFPGTALVTTMNNDLTISKFAKLTFNEDSCVLNGNPLRQLAHWTLLLHRCDAPESPLLSRHAALNTPSFDTPTACTGRARD